MYQGLPCGKYCTTTEILQFNLVGYLFTNLKIRLDQLRFLQGNLIRHSQFFRIILNNFPVPPNFKVPLFGIQNNIKVLVCSKFAFHHASKYIFHNSHHGCTINVPKLFEFRERSNQNLILIDGLGFGFNSHNKEIKVFSKDELKKLGEHCALLNIVFECVLDGHISVELSNISITIFKKEQPWLL